MCRVQVGLLNFKSRLNFSPGFNMSSFGFIGTASLIVAGGVILLFDIIEYIQKKRAQREDEWRESEQSSADPEAYPPEQGIPLDFRRRPRASASPRSRAHATIDDEYAKARFPGGAWMYKWFLPMKLLRDMEIVANECDTTDKEVLRFKKSQMSILGFNTTAVSRDPTRFCYLVHELMACGIGINLLNRRSLGLTP
jgi:hypothetical protein